MFHRILVGIDDSPAARAALARAIELVEAGHGRLGLLSSAPGAPHLPIAGPAVAPVTREELERELIEWAEGNIETAAQLVPVEIPLTKMVTRGSPGRALLREARTGCWDLVVVGQAPRRFHIGRVGDWLNRRSPTPVLVVHEQPTRTRPSRRRLRLRRRRSQVSTA